MHQESFRIRDSKEEEHHCSVNTTKGLDIQQINAINYMDTPTIGKVGNMEEGGLLEEPIVLMEIKILK